MKIIYFKASLRKYKLKEILIIIDISNWKKICSSKL